MPAYLIAAGYVISTFGWTLGREIFPGVDVGRFQLRIKAPTGTRIERTEQIVRQTLEQISREVGEDQIAISVGYAGNLPSTYALNAIYQWTGGPGEALLRVALKETCHVPIEDLKIRLREVLSRRMPEVRFSFEPADIVSDVMSFGAPSPVEVAISGPDFDDTRAFAAKIASELERVPALRDLQYGQALDYPTVRVDFDRQRAGLSGISAAEMARSLVTATSSSRFVLPNFWPDPKTGMGYQVQVEIPYTIMDSIEQVEAIPIKESRGRTALLRDVASLRADTMAGEYDRYNLRRTLTLSANIVGSDLGHVSSQVHRAIKRAGEPPRGVQVAVRGQIVPMEEILSGLSVGLAVAIVVILLLLMANFQSIRLAIVVVSTVPAALAGVVLALSAGGATLNIQSFIGAIMAIGVGVSNAILLITFAERERMGGRESTDAAVIGARYRLRPIVMTTCAMIVGMVPLALALGEGGQQSAPLGIAVIGGLGAATLATLLVLPAVFALVQRRAGRLSVSLDPFDLTSTHYVCSQERDHAAAV